MTLSKKKKIIITIFRKKKLLEEGYMENPSEELKKEIDDINNELNSYNKVDEIEYYLDTGFLLNEYYSKKEESQVNTEITVVDFMNKNKKNKKEDNLINNYMRIIDDTVIKDNFNCDLENCPYCLGSLILKNIDSLLICEECGYTDSIIINSEKRYIF